MAATTGGALKAYLEGLGLGLPVFRDRVRDGQVPPYAVVLDNLNVSRINTGDHGDQAAPVSVEELVQLDLWQLLRFPAGHAQAGKNAEDYALPETLDRRLSGARLPASPTVTFGVSVLGWRRLPDPDPNLVHHVYNLVVRRELRS